jgi:hypothetical protein
MNRLWIALFLCSGFAAAADLPKVQVPDCFKVHRLLKTDDAHYWADWTNTCPYTIDAVYVMVHFFDHSLKQLGDGVWPMYFVRPGVHRVTRFSIPAEAAGFEFIRVKEITTNWAKALR